MAAIRAPQSVVRIDEGGAGPSDQSRASYQDRPPTGASRVSPPETALAPARPGGRFYVWRVRRVRFVVGTIVRLNRGEGPAGCGPSAFIRRPQTPANCRRHLSVFRENWQEAVRGRFMAVLIDLTIRADPPRNRDDLFARLGLSEVANHDGR